jgi:hypothetical protein
VILHYLINKNRILELAEEWQQQQQQQQQNQSVLDNEGINDETSVDNQTGLMTFVLETSGGVQGDEQEQISSSSSDLISDTGGIHVSISWPPQPLVPASNSTLRINFTDAFSGGLLNADVMYDLIVLDNNGSLVISKEGLIANGSNDTQTLLFPADGRYQLELHIKWVNNIRSGYPRCNKKRNSKGVRFCFLILTSL